MTKQEITKIASTLLTINDCNQLTTSLEQSQFNNARLVIDKKLMELEEQQQLFRLEGCSNPLIEFELTQCNMIYDYIINEIEVQFLMKERANGRKRNTRRAVISSN